MAKAKKEDPVAIKAKEKEDEIKQHIKEDLGSLFSQLSSLKKDKQPEHLTEYIIDTPIGEVPELAQIELVGEPSLDRYLKAPIFNEPKKPEVDVSRELKLLSDKFKFMEQWIGKIANAGPGSGEVNLRYLDDVKRDTIADGRWLKWSEADKKFVFDEINPYEVVYNTTLVTTATYTVQDNDWYIGVNRAGPVSITLPTSPSSGRVLVIKDESGNASVNPITVLGTVDNDAGGFILQMDNGGIQMVYRSGWRVV